MTATGKTFSDTALGRDIQILEVRKPGNNYRTLVRHEYGYGAFDGKWEIWRTYPTLAAGAAGEYGRHPAAVRHVTEHWEKHGGYAEARWQLATESHTEWSPCMNHECQYGCVGSNLAMDRRV